MGYGGWIGDKSSPGEQSQALKVLVLFPDNFGANCPLNLDNFENFGWEITLVGLRQTVQPCPSFAAPWGFLPITVDILVSAINDIAAYDCLIIMPATQYAGTNPYGDLLSSASTLDLVRSAVDASLVVYATCAGVRVLAAADVIEGVRVTGHANFRNEYIAAGAVYVGGNQAPVIDQNIVTTTRGLYFNIQNCEAVATAAENRVR